MASPVVDHVVPLVRDHVASRRLYGAALAPLGFSVLSVSEAEEGAAFGVDGYDDFAINRNDTPGTGAHVAFIAEDRVAVDAFHAAAMADAARDKGSPPIWAAHSPGSDAAVVYDLDGNTIEAVSHDPSPSEADAQGT